MSQVKPTTTAEFITHVSDAFARVRPLLESNVHPGYCKLDNLYSLTLIKGLDKTQNPNRRALEIHVQTYAKDVLDHPTELIQSVLAMQTSDLATISDTLDSEVSAFVSSTPTKNPVSTPKGQQSSNSKTTPKLARRDSTADGSKIANRDDHWCLKLVGLYYYHKLENCKRRPKIGAHSAVIPDPPSTTADSLELATYRSEALAAHHTAEALELSSYRADAAYRLGSQNPHALVAHTSLPSEDRARHANILANQLLQAGFMFPTE
jgi:hypothetical protein